MSKSPIDYLHHILDECNYIIPVLKEQIEEIIKEDDENAR